MFDRYLDVRWRAPATLSLHVYVVPAGAGKTSGMHAPGTHIFTPETERSTHYFMSGVKRAEAPPPDAFDPIAAEDKPMLEAQQRRMGNRDFWDMNPVILGIDGGGVLARRLLATRMKAEDTQ